MAEPYELPGNTDFSALGVFNAICSAYGGGMSPSNTALQNYTALAATVEAARVYSNNPYNNHSGAMVFIPPGIYEIAGTVEINGSTDDLPLLISGAGSATQLVQQSSVDTFLVLALGNNSRGVRFMDFVIAYNAEGGALSGAAVHAEKGENVSCEYMFFVDCPLAAQLDAGALKSGLINCIVQYTNGSNDATMVALNGPEQYVKNCLLSQPSQTQSGAPTGCTAIVMQNQIDNVFISNVHISNFTFGVQVLDGQGNDAARPFLWNVLCEAWQTALTVNPDKQVYQGYFKNCVFARAQGSTETTSPGILIESNGGVVTDLMFESCMSYGWGGAGIEIASGENIIINGGRFGSNGLGVSARGGIAITGSCSDITIDGADCSGVVPGFAQQPNGIAISAAVSSLHIHNANLTGNLAALSVSVLSQGIEVTQCAGYNDVGRVVSETAPASMAQFSNYTFGHYGPVSFYTPGPVEAISIDGQVTNLTAGSFDLSPGEFAAINHPSPTRLPFLMVGG